MLTYYIIKASICNVIYHQFSHDTYAYRHIGEIVYIMLEFNLQNDDNF